MKQWGAGSTVSVLRLVDFSYDPPCFVVSFQEEFLRVYRPHLAVQVYYLVEEGDDTGVSTQEGQVLETNANRRRALLLEVADPVPSPAQGVKVSMRLSVTCAETGPVSPNKSVFPIIQKAGETFFIFRSASGRHHVKLLRNDDRCPIQLDVVRQPIKIPIVHYDAAIRITGLDGLVASMQPNAVPFPPKLSI